MILLLLLPILVAGFIVLTKHPIHFYKLHRYEGQLLYLSSAFQGLLCSLVAIGILLGTNLMSPKISTWAWSFLEELFEPFINSKDAIWLFLITGFSILVALLRAAWFRVRSWIKYTLINFGGNNKTNLGSKVLTDLFLMGSILKDSPLDSLFYESFVATDPEKYLMLTMEDGKIYVGKVIGLGEPTESEGMDQEIVITPFLSGYRKKETLKVIFTTKYFAVESDISLVLRQDKIISATVFETEIYNEFQEQGPPQSNEYRVVRVK